MLCEGKVACNFVEQGQSGSPNSMGVSKGHAWGLFGGEPSVTVAHIARAVQGCLLSAMEQVLHRGNRMRATAIKGAKYGCRGSMV